MDTKTLKYLGPLPRVEVGDQVVERNENITLPTKIANAILEQQIIYKPKIEAVKKDGKPVKDKKGNPVMKPVKDENGKPVMEVTGSQKHWSDNAAPDKPETPKTETPERPNAPKTGDRIPVKK